MKGTGHKLASCLLAAVLGMTPTIPVLASGAVNDQSRTDSHPQQAFSYKASTYKATGATPRGATQVLHGTVNPMVTSGKATRLSDTDPNRRMRLDFVLKPRDREKMTSFAAAGKKVSVSEYKAEFAPTNASVQTVENFLKRANLQVVTSNDDMLVIEGTATQIEKALHIKFNDYKVQNYQFYSTTSDPILPADVATALQGIIGLTQTPYHSVPMQSKQKLLDMGSNGSFTPDTVRTAYGMIPAYGNGIDGTGRNIAILMTGDFSDNDVKTFSQTFGLPYDAKKIKKQILSGASVPSNGIDEESTLDVEWSHAIAPGANITEYETGRLDDQDLLYGLDVILNSSPRADVINMSFGGEEGYMAPATLDAWHMMMAQAVVKGITPVASSGDSGAYGYEDPMVSVQSPASDPFVLSVGGTMLTVDSNNNRTGETAWGEAPFGAWDQGNTWGSGGGYSDVFADLAGDSSQKRRVPDVSALARNVEMYATADGGWLTADGTSFAAPIWSGIVALASQKANHGLGWLNPGLRNMAAHAGNFRDITAGNNGAYQAAAGWDAVTGWGSPGNGWALVQAMAAQSLTTIHSGPQIDGMVVSNAAFGFEQKIMNGVGTVDLLGSGFGNVQGQGYVTLSQGDKNYTVPVKKWTDTDITLLIDADDAGNGLFSVGKPHPNQPGTYQLVVHTDQKAKSNAMNVQLADFLAVTDSSSETSIPTPVSGKEPVYQDVTIQAIIPDGTVTDTSLQDMTLRFAVLPKYNSVMTGIVVRQNGQPCQQNPDGSFQVHLTGGQTVVQVASQHPGGFLYEVSGKNLDGYDDAAQFAMPSQAGVQLVNESTPGYNYAATGRDNLVSVALEDANGNIASDADRIQVTLAPDAKGLYPTGNITINDPNNSDPDHGDLPVTPPTGAHPKYVTTLDGGGYSPTMLNVSDTAAESVALLINDLDNSGVPPLKVQLFFTAAHTLKMTATEKPNGVPVSIPGQAPNWQELRVDVLDGEGKATAFAGNSYLELLGNQDYLSHERPAYQVEVFDGASQSWKPLQANKWGAFPISLAKGAIQLRVASPKAESVTFQAEMDFSTDISTDAYIGQFNAGALRTLTAQPMLPHMATSPTQSPQYVAVGVAGMDANGNSVPANDAVVLSEPSKSPLFTVALADKNGNLRVLQQVKGTWKFTLSQLINHQIYIASAQPGVAMFQLADASQPHVNPALFRLDFVNSMVAKLQMPAPRAAAVGAGVQTVEVDLVDQNGQQVVNANDQVGLALGSHKGKVKVTDAKGNPLPVDGSGRYQAQAMSGAANFYITDSVAETVTYTCVDLSESKVTGAKGVGSFVTPTGIVMTPIANSTLGANQSAAVTLTSTDLTGKTLGRSQVFLSFRAVNGGGQAVVISDANPQGMALNATAQPFTTDDQGKLTIVYKTPRVLPNGGVETITAQDSDRSPHVVATDSYKYMTVARYAWSNTGNVIAQSGSLSAGQPVSVTLTALDSRQQAIPYTTVYLSLTATSLGGKAVVKGQSSNLTDRPAPYLTDAKGQIVITYTSPQHLPSNETDLITAQDAGKSPHVKATVSYTYKAAGKLSFVPSTPGQTGRLQPGQSVDVTLYVQDLYHIAMPNTVVFLSLTSVGNNRAVVGPANAINNQTDLTAEPLPFVTDAQGKIHIVYTVVHALPTYQTNLLFAQDAAYGERQNATLRYPFF